MQYRINRINTVQNKSVTSKSQGICGQRYKNGGLGQSQSLDGSSILSIKVGIYCFCFSVSFPPNTKCSKQDSYLYAFLGNFITNCSELSCLYRPVSYISHQNSSRSSYVSESKEPYFFSCKRGRDLLGGKIFQRNFLRDRVSYF